MNTSKERERAMNPASLYATRQPRLFLALTPAVCCTLAILAPMSLAGLVVIIPGLSGVAGLIGLTMAWCALLRPGIAARRGGTIVFLLLAALPAIALGMSTFLLGDSERPPHAVDPMQALAPAATIFAVLASFFIAGILVSNTSTDPAPGAYTRRWKRAGWLVVLLTLPLPLGCVLVAADFGKRIRHEQAAEADALSRRALAAVDTYRSTHDGALPLDNAGAGLPAPGAMSDTYVASVTVVNGVVDLRYRDTFLSREFGAGAADVSLTFNPVPRKGSFGAYDAWRWSCTGQGYRLEGDTPLLLDDRCENPAFAVSPRPPVEWSI